MNLSKASYFLRIGKTYLNLEYSSVNMMNYSCSPRVWTLKGQRMSVYTNSKHFLALYSLVVKFSDFALNAMNLSKASYFLRIRKTYLNLEYSSVNMMNYSCSPRVWTLKGQRMSIYTNSKHFLALYSLVVKGLFVILPSI